MNINEALELFKIDDLSQITEEELKKMYRTYCFMYHPDAHPNEDVDFYKEMMQKINEGYSILKEHILFTDIKTRKTESERQREEEQIEKEKILMDIIVRAYYASKNEIDKINADFLDMFLSIPQKVGHMRTVGYKTVAGYRHISEAFENKAKMESEIMNKHIEKFAKEFVSKYGIEMNFLEVIGGEYINFLNRTNWYEKYKNYQEEENNNKKRLN